MHIHRYVEIHMWGSYITVTCLYKAHTKLTPNTRATNLYWFVDISSSSKTIRNNNIVVVAVVFFFSFIFCLFEQLEGYKLQVNSRKTNASLPKYENSIVYACWLTNIELYLFINNFAVVIEKQKKIWVIRWAALAEYFRVEYALFC